MRLVVDVRLFEAKVVRDLEGALLARAENPLLNIVLCLLPKKPMPGTGPC